MRSGIGTSGREDGAAVRERRGGQLILVVVAVLWLLPTTANGGLVVVPDEFASINDALAAIGEFDTVLVRAGTYVEDVGLGPGGHPVSYRLLSEEGPHTTVVIGRFNSGISEAPSDLVIGGFTFRESRGVHIVGSGPSRVALRHCIVEENSNGGSGLGGGVSILAASPFAQPWVLVDSCVIRNNEGDRGGGLYCYNGGLIRGTAITDNTAVEGGAGVYVGSGGWIELENCTIAGNRISGSGGPYVGAGVEVHGINPGHRLALLETIVVGNNGGFGVTSDLPATPIVACVDAWGNEGGNYAGFPDPTGINGNISLDPEFCDPEMGDYRLRAASPCAPEHSPPGCGLIGALPVGCGVQGIENQETARALPRLVVLPNPASGLVEFRMSGLLGSAVIEIYNSRGEAVGVLTGGGRTIRWLPGVEVSSGVYFARALAGGQPVVAKFVLTR